MLHHVATDDEIVGLVSEGRDVEHVATGFLMKPGVSVVGNPRESLGVGPVVTESNAPETWGAVPFHNWDDAAVNLIAEARDKGAIAGGGAAP